MIQQTWPAATLTLTLHTCAQTFSRPGCAWMQFAKTNKQTLLTKSDSKQLYSLLPMLSYTCIQWWCCRMLPEWQRDCPITMIEPKKQVMKRHEHFHRNTYYKFLTLSMFLATTVLQRACVYFQQHDNARSISDSMLPGATQVVAQLTEPGRCLAEELLADNTTGRVWISWQCTRHALRLLRNRSIPC